MATRVYPSFPPLINQPTAINVRSGQGIVVANGQVLVSGADIFAGADEISYAKALDRLYPHWRQEMEILECESAQEYATRIKEICTFWASDKAPSKFIKLKYMPPNAGNRNAVRALLNNPKQNYVNPLAINDQYALVAIKQDSAEDFHLAYCHLGGALEGFYRPSTIKLPFISTACLVGNLGYVADSETIYHFVIEPKEGLKILWQQPNPTLPKLNSPNAAEVLATRFAEILMTANKSLLLVARHNEKIYTLDAETGHLLSSIPCLATSLYLTETEISWGTDSGKIASCSYTHSNQKKLKLYPKPKRDIKLAKDWELFAGTSLTIRPQQVNTHVIAGNLKNFVMASLEEALVFSDLEADQHAVVDETEPIVSFSIIGDLVVSLSRTYNLYFTQVAQSVPLKRIRFFDECTPAPLHRQLVWATPHVIWALAANGEIIKTAMQ